MEGMRYPIKLNMEDTGTQLTTIRVKQGDSAVTFVLRIYKNGVNVFSTDDIPSIVFKRPDGSSVVGECSVAEGQYTYKFLGNELSIAGTITADVKFNIYTATESTVTFTFQCVVDTLPQVEMAGTYVNSLKSIKTYLDETVTKLEQELEAFNLQQVLDAVNEVNEAKEDVEAVKSELEEYEPTLQKVGTTDISAVADTVTEAIVTLNNTKAAVSTTLEGYGITDAYTKTEVDTAVGAKADSSTTLAGYGITDAYTKTETDGLLDEKSPLAGSSSLTTCSQGTFGAGATKDVTTSVTSGSAALITSGAVYTKLNTLIKEVAAVYSSSTTYEVGEYVNYSDSVWKCIVQCKGQAPSTSSTYWSKVSLADEVGSLSTNLTELGENIKDYVTVVSANGSITLTTTVPQNSCTLSFTCPSGYKAICIVPYSAGSWDWCWNGIWLSSQSTATCIIRNTGTTYATVDVTATVICVRDL